VQHRRNFVYILTMIHLPHFAGEYPGIWGRWPWKWTLPRFLYNAPTYRVSSYV